LFLSANNEDVRLALEAGFPAARVYARAPNAGDPHPDEVRIAFDGDAVVFSDQAEKVYQAGGLQAFEEHEKSRATEPLPPGPLQPFLRALHKLQNNPPRDQRMRIRTALVTARSAPAHDRAIRTLMSWNIEVDEAMFLGGLDKGPFLQVFEPDFFFDDQMTHLTSAVQAGAPAGHVDSGVTNAPAPTPVVVAAAAAAAAQDEAAMVNKLIRSRRTERA
jgi:5'-nucleotidase